MLEVTGREGRGSQTPTSVDHYLAICGYVKVVNEEACPSHLPPRAQQDQSSVLRSGALEYVQYLVAFTVSVWTNT